MNVSRGVVSRTYPLIYHVLANGSAYVGTMIELLSSLYSSCVYESTTILGSVAHPYPDRGFVDRAAGEALKYKAAAQFAH